MRETYYQIPYSKGVFNCTEKDNINGDRIIETTHASGVKVTLSFAKETDMDKYNNFVELTKQLFCKAN